MESEVYREISIISTTNERFYRWKAIVAMNPAQVVPLFECDYLKLKASKKIRLSDLDAL